MNDFVGAGWTFPLAIGPTGKVDVSRGQDKIEQAMRLILSTRRGERPMRPLWGSTLYDCVFGGTGPENVAEIGRAVKTALDLWEPRANVLDVSVHPGDGTDALVYIDILYQVVGTNSPRNLVFPFYTIPEGAEGAS